MRRPRNALLRRVGPLLALSTTLLLGSQCPLTPAPDVCLTPLADDEPLGSGKWNLGPGVHLTYHKDKLSAGLFLWNFWSVGGDSDRKNVNQMTMKPYFIYNLTDKWNVLYIPLGISASWDKPSSQRWKIPLGGGLGFRGCHRGDFHLAQEPGSSLPPGIRAGPGRAARR